MWLGVVVVLVGLLEANALLADKGPTTKPIEKVSGVIHWGLLLALVFYVLGRSHPVSGLRFAAFPFPDSAGPRGRLSLSRGRLRALAGAVSGRKAGRAVLRSLGALFLAAAAIQLGTACNKRESAANADPKVRDGRAVYISYCIAQPRVLASL